MGIIINLDVVMAQRKKGLTELAKDVDITLANLSILSRHIKRQPLLLENRKSKSRSIQHIERDL